jgi:uncharacterized protein (DUF58 family)
MHFALRGYLFVALTALLGVASTWSDVPAFAGAWLLPASLLLLGLAIEAWYLRGTKVTLAMRYDDRLKLGRTTQGAFAFEHNRRRDIVLQYARVLPPALKQSTEVRHVAVPAAEELRDPTDLVPLRLGAGRFGNVPARLLGRFALAWWGRELNQDAAFTVAPDSRPRRARPVPGESAGETPRRLPGSGVELLQLRDYVTGDALSRVDWKATARRGTLVSREYSEAQHLEILVVIDAGRSSRVRAGELDRLGLYANVAARLAEHAVSVEDRVGLLVYSGRTLSACTPDRGLRAVTRLRRQLATLESDRGESNPVAAAIQVRRLLRHRGLVVWLTDLAEPWPQRRTHAGREGAGAAPSADHRGAARRGDRAPRGEAARGWRDPAIALAAREHHLRAQVQVASMRRQGIVVLDEPDDRLDQAVLDSYLLLRRRKRV